MVSAALNYRNLCHCFIYIRSLYDHTLIATGQKLLNTFKSTFLASVFCSRDGPSVCSSLPSPASVLSGDVSESEEVCMSPTRLLGTSESVSESGVRLEGVEQAGEDSIAFSFSAGSQKIVRK